MAAMPPLVRPLTADDLDDLRPLDSEYSRRTGCEELVEPASLSFFERTGHAFVLEERGAPRGFLLAQAIWDGRRPRVLVGRVVASDDSGRAALLEALTKSAYDAGVYDLVVELPEADSAAAPTLASCGYHPRESRLYGRVLGSRAGRQ
jgi:hypothetical protein